MIGVARSRLETLDVAFSPDGQRIMSCSPDGRLQMWNVKMLQSSRQTAEVQEENDMKTFA